MGFLTCIHGYVHKAVVPTSGSSGGQVEDNSVLYNASISYFPTLQSCSPINTIRGSWTVIVQLCVGL